MNACSNCTCANCLHYFPKKNYCETDGGLTTADNSCKCWEPCTVNTDNSITLHNALDEIRRLKHTRARLIRSMECIRSWSLSAINHTPPFGNNYRTALDAINTEAYAAIKEESRYWFFNCEPTHCETFQKDKEQRHISDRKLQSKQGGICSEERSMISPDYARNFICDFIIGGGQKAVCQQKDLFDLA